MPDCFAFRTTSNLGGVRYSSPEQLGPSCKIISPTGCQATREETNAEQEAIFLARDEPSNLDHVLKLIFSLVQAPNAKS